MVVMTIFVEVAAEEVPCRRHPHHRGVVDIAGEVPDEEVDEGVVLLEEEIGHYNIMIKVVVGTATEEVIIL